MTTESYETGWSYDEVHETWRPPGVKTTPDTRSTANAILPVGMMAPYWGTTAPTGWLICDGSSFAAASYPALYALLGGTTLPNLKGRVIVGYDPADTDYDAMGETGGAKTVTLTAAQMPTHNHNLKMGLIQADNYLDTRLYMAGGTTIQNEGIGTNTYNRDHVTVIGTAGSDGAHANVQPYIALNYIIKAA